MSNLSTSDLLYLMRSVQRKEYYDYIIMTYNTEDKIKKYTKKDVYDNPNAHKDYPFTLNGVPYEVYDTILECNVRALELTEEGKKVLVVNE